MYGVTRSDRIRNKYNESKSPSNGDYPENEKRYIQKVETLVERRKMTSRSRR